MGNTRKFLWVLLLSASFALLGCGTGGSSGSLNAPSKPSSEATGSILGVAASGMSSGIYGGFKNVPTSFTIESAHQELAKSFAHQALMVPNNQMRLMTGASIHVTIPSTSVTCSGGGSGSVSGSMDMTASVLGTTSFVLDYSMTLDETFTGCVTTGASGATYTVTGNMNIDGATGHFAMDIVSPIENSSIDATFTFPITGTINVTGGATLTNCVLDAKTVEIIRGTFTTLGISTSWSGTVCGSPASGSYSVTP